jgi:5-(carboxyamino)imidazole ribonucleotide synthase
MSPSDTVPTDLSGPGNNAGLDAPLAILGSGQLAYLMASAARNLDTDTLVIAPEADGPARHSATRYEQHALTDADWLGAQAATGQTLTFDFEAIPAPALERLIERGNAATRRQAKVLRRLQNKLHQKQWLAESGFPTPAFAPLDLAQPGRPAAGTGPELTALGFPVVQKLATGGYDGRGVQILRSEAALTELWPGSSYLEVFVPRMQELTVIVARSLHGEVRCYDPAATYFDSEGQCLDYWIAPAPVTPALARHAAELASRVVDALEGVGIYAVELFAAEGGELLVNEISARVHNAGHHTIEGNRCSQFEQHVRAVLDLPLGSVARRAPVAVSQNLLAGRHPAEPLLGGTPGVIGYAGAQLHWYGKTSAPPLRKMGHITATGAEQAAARAAIDALLAGLADGTLSAADIQPLQSLPTGQAK